LPARLFASFGNETKASDQGANLNPITYSEKGGDAQMGSIEVAAPVAVVKGQIGNAKGSQWAGIGVLVSHDKAPVPLDLSGYRALKLTLSSPTVTVLRVRIAADDSKILNLGCYPVFMQSVGPTAKDYTIPFARFEPESFCGDNARSMKATVGKVTYVEVVDTANQRNKPTEFAVGRIEFVQ
jgi:hypothetical protein